MELSIAALMLALIATLAYSLIGPGGGVGFGAPVGSNVRLTMMIVVSSVVLASAADRRRKETRD